ncbi:hypothetical protein J3U22_03170 [Gilliamella sp. B2865]|nr:hypothetical protein [Gilliamella sp. B2865]MCX8678597.1 hypothetical protein [Gilliamella sp. B2865]
MKISEITAQAVGKWYYIFHSLGIEVGNCKHCPCPRTYRGVSKIART